MTNKKLSAWTWDNYHKLFSTFYDVDPNDLRSYIDDLKGLIDSVGRVFSFRSPPAELVFATLKEVLLYARHFFSDEHTDIIRRNPNIRIVYEPTMFHGIEGTTEIDTGLPTNRGTGVTSPQPRNEPFLEEYFGDLLQEVIELQKAYFKKKPFFFEKYYDFLIERAGTIKKVPSSGSPTSIEQSSNQTLILKRQAAYWQRKYFTSVRKRPSNKSTKNLRNYT